MNESAATALAHLEMIAQAARGEYSPRSGEVEKRKAAVLAFILTRQCLADEDIRALAVKITELVNSHFSTVNVTAATDAA